MSTGTAGEDPATTDPGEGFVSVRTGLVGLGYVWLTAVSAVGAVGAAAYGVTVSPVYLVVAILLAGVAVSSANASLRRFGYR